MMTPQQREDLLREAVERGRYAKLYHKLKSLPRNEWSASFDEIEQLLSPHTLPKSARLYRPWWANDARGSHTHANAWLVAGFITARVNLAGETLVFVRK
jgi:hypothetical protein